MAIPQIPDWRERILLGVGARPTTENLRFFDAWAHSEGGSAENNPFNTTQVSGQKRNYNDLGSGIGVQRYLTPQQGIDATINTLTNGRYGNIIGALRAGDDAMKAAAALRDSPWGTGALTMKVLGGNAGDYTPVGETAPTTGSPLSSLGSGSSMLGGLPKLGEGASTAAPEVPEGLRPLGGAAIMDIANPSPFAVRMMANLGEASKRITEARSDPDASTYGFDRDNMPVAKTLAPLQTGSSDSKFKTLDLAQDFDGELHPNANPIVNMAQQYLGTPYLFGGADPRKGFDCSGFVQYLYSQAGIALGRTTYDQVKQGQPIPDAQNLQAGDVVFFSQGGDVHHEGLYIGGGQFIHAPHTGDVVKISSLSEKYYASQFIGGRRFIAPTGDVPAK